MIHISVKIDLQTKKKFDFIKGHLGGVTAEEATVYIINTVFDKINDDIKNGSPLIKEG